MLNSVDLFILDPLYEDSRMVLLQLKGVIAMKEADTEWQNASHPATYTTIWREREQDSCTSPPTQSNSQDAARSSHSRT